YIEYVNRVRVFNVKQASRFATHEYVTARQNNISPCLHASGQGIALIPFSPPLASRGMARRQGAVPGLLQANVRQRPDHGARRCTRALRRANGHLRLTPRQPSDHPGAICPWGAFSERRPWAGLRDCRPAGALPIPALRTPPEGALEPWIGTDYT